ncbi:hypothetical protein ACGFW5_12045 [Streptomyces sp. NPDC048416]|uniref:hypothetical protein n=1 Tax=Streptomyces sp. NPDC048416 TaxID=3365546 RepID=UPI003724B929
MSGFATHRQRVHDVGLTLRARHASLRTCAVMFAPYGFRATYHHLCRSAGVPAVLEADPRSLVRAVEEVHAARQLWLTDRAAYIAHRRREKAAGQRDPSRGGPRGTFRGGSGVCLAHCPDPGFHPTDPLPVVVARLLRCEGSASCPACDGQEGTTRWNSGYAEHELCARCGISLGSRPVERDVRVIRERDERWQAIWRRTA